MKIKFYTLMFWIACLAGCNSSEKSKPTISSITPDVGEEGDPIVIKGTFLATSKSISFGSNEAIVLDAQSDQVTTQVPAGATVGSAKVTVTNDGGTSGSFDFVVLPPSPVLPTGQQAAITKTIPSNSYKKYPIMILGSNLLSTTKVLFDAVEATIITKYNSSVTVFVPDLPNGTYTIKIVTGEKGNSNGQPITIISAPGGFQAPPSAGFISPPPANFAATISNQWSIFLLSVGSGNCPLIDLTDVNFCGSYKFTKNATTKAVTENFIKFTRDNSEYFYGQWSSPFVVPCIQRIVFISDKDGRFFEATVDVSAFVTSCE